MVEHSSSELVSAASVEAGHEVTDADAGPLLQVGIAMATLIVVAFLSVIVIYKVLGYYQPMLNDEPHPLSLVRAEAMTGPLLEVDSPRVRLVLRSQEDEILNNYSWVDQNQRMVRIPVSRAMDLLADRGLPVKPATE